MWNSSASTCKSLGAPGRCATELHCSRLLRSMFLYTFAGRGGWFLFWGILALPSTVSASISFICGVSVPSLLACIVLDKQHPINCADYRGHHWHHLSRVGLFHERQPQGHLWQRLLIVVPLGLSNSYSLSHAHPPLPPPLKSIARSAAGATKLAFRLQATTLKV